MTKKQIKYIAEIPGEYGQPLHDGDDVPLLFDTPDAAFFAGQDMNGVNMWGEAFIVRRVTESDIDPEDYPDILFADMDNEEDYPLYIGQNGAKWVREYYMKILFELLLGEPNKASIRNHLNALPNVDPNKELLADLLRNRGLI